MSQDVIAGHEAYIAFLRTENRRLEMRYPGVCPAWVSGEIGTNLMHIARVEEEIKELKNEKD